jgi:cation transport ATPase
VVARATPADKLRIVRLLQDRTEVVAVTRDGTNDARRSPPPTPASRWEGGGTALASEGADLVLTDDAHPTVAAAIEGGRNIGSQRRRAVAFYLGAKLALVAGGYPFSRALGRLWHAQADAWLRPGPPPSRACPVAMRQLPHPMAAGVLLLAGPAVLLSYG